MINSIKAFFGVFLLTIFCKKGFRRLCYFLLLFFCLISTESHAQQSTLDIAGMHQLISQSQDENKLQVKAKNQQAANTANEEANLTLLAKLKNTYRTLQERYNSLGTAINIAEIGFYATPMVEQIVAYQKQIVSLTEKNPVLVVLGVQTEIEFAGKAKSLIGYVAGLSLSIGDVNQMKASDRKMLFDYVITELSTIQELSGNLVETLQSSSLNSILRSINPFQDFVDKDKSVAEDIIFNAKYLKQ
jgi:hypothetical protein